MHFRERNPPSTRGGGLLPFTLMISTSSSLIFADFRGGGQYPNPLSRSVQDFQNYRTYGHHCSFTVFKFFPEQELLVLLSGDRKHAFNIRYLLYLSYILCILFTIITMFIIFNCLYDLFCYYFIPFVCFLLSFSVLNST